MTVREWGRRGRDTCFPRLGRSPAPAAAPWLPRGRSRLSRAGRRAAGRPQTPPSALPPFPPACPGARSVLHRQGAGAASRRRGPIGRGGDAGEEARRRVGFLLATRGGEGEPEQLGRKRSANGRRRRRLPSASGSTDRGEAEGGRARRRGGREAGAYLMKSAIDWKTKHEGSRCCKVGGSCGSIFTDILCYFSSI